MKRLLLVVLLSFLAAMPARADGLAISPMLEREIPSANLKLFPKWLTMLERHAGSRGRVDTPCTRSQFGECAADAWTSMLARLRGQPPAQQIEAVNATMNRARYVTDMQNWGIEDYWETPSEFFAKDGDCEDYAIAKFMSLRELGFPSAALRIVVVQDMNLMVPHAVLAVHQGQEWLLLDNQVTRVVELRQVRHYRPIYSLNESGWWLHK